MPTADESMAVPLDDGWRDLSDGSFRNGEPVLLQYCLTPAGPVSVSIGQWGANVGGWLVMHPDGWTWRKCLYPLWWRPIPEPRDPSHDLR